MKQSDLRKWHRNMGIALTLFIILQAGSGLLISINEMGLPHSHAHSESVSSVGHSDDGGSLLKDLVSFIHHGAGAAGAVYRVLLGIGMLGMAVTGSMIFLKIRVRTKKVRNEQ